MVDNSRRDETISNKIHAEIEDIIRFISGMDENDFFTDTKTQKAVAMSLINIGELTKAYSDDFTRAKSAVPWKKVQAMRNIAAHRYEAVDMQVVWKTIKEDLTVLQNIVANELLNKLPPEA